LYEAFVKKDPNGWLVNNYEIIDECRFKPNIDYRDLIVFGIKNNGKLVAGATMNMNINKLQLKEMGFGIDLKKYNEMCEGINFFIIENMKDNLFLKIKQLFEFGYSYLKKKKYFFITCSEKLIKFYKLLGFEFIESRNINNEIKCLMLLKINNGEKKWR